MPKRVAEEYITKDHGSIANPAPAQNQPTMSTAAQLAKRKIAQPKGRLGASRSSHSTFGATTNTNQSGGQPTFGSVNGGITFGASQSFPSGITPQGGGFDFQLPQSSSFTFGAPSTGPSNPFANLNGNASSDNERLGDDISMQSPQKKRNIGGPFGSSNTENSMASGFTFGQQPQPQPQSNGGFTFGSSQPAPAAVNGAGLFGRIGTPEEPAQNSNNIFGQPQQTASAFTGFGQSTTPAQTTSSFSFGSQTSSAPKTQEPTFGFGQTNNNAASSSTAFGFPPAQSNNEPAQTPAFSFGQPAAQAPSSSFSFGQPTSAPQKQGGDNGFGSSGTAAPFSFGQTQSAPPAQNLFGGFNAAPAQENKATKPLFGSQVNNAQQPAETVDKNAAAVQNNPFAGLFAQSKSSSQDTSSVPAFSFGASVQKEAPTTTPSGSLGLFKQQTGPSFGQDPTDTSMNTATSMSAEPSQIESESTPIANQPSASEPKASSGGLFSPAASSSTTSGPANGLFGSVSSTPAPTKPLFSFGKPSQPTSSDLSSENPDTSTNTPTIPKAKPIFGTVSDSDAPTTPKSSGKDLFAGGSRSDFQSAQNQPKGQTQPTATVFTPAPSVKSTPQNAKPSLFSASSTRQEESTAKLNTAEDAEPLKRMVYTKAAPIIPGSLEAEQYREYDKNYRLHSLNVGLQNKLASLDPRSQDFHSLIRQYVASRESIGESLGLYVRNVAGMKRKGDLVEEPTTDSLQNKRQRSDDVPPSSDIAASVTAPQTQQKTFTPFPSTTESSPSKATSVLKGMIPANNSAIGSTNSSTPTPKATAQFGGFTASTASKPANPFAGLTAPNSAAANRPSFGNTLAATSLSSGSTEATAESTTPTKSPPKKPAFEVPKFGGGNTNFMAAFGAKAKASAAKLEKTLMEKRKAEDFDSEEDDEEEFNKQLEEETRAKRAKIDAVAKAGFVPSFGSTTSTTATSTKPSFTFGSAPTTSKDASQPKSGNSKTSGSTPNRFAAFTDSNDDQSDSAQGEDEDEQANESDEGEENDEEGGSSRDSEEQEEDELPEDEVDISNGDTNDGDYKDDGESESDGEEFTTFQKEMDRARRRDARKKNAGKSLFDRIEPNPTRATETPVNGTEKEKNEESTSPIFGSAKNSTFKPGIWGDNIGHATPEKPSFSPLTPSGSQSGSTYKPASTFNFTAAPTTALTPTPGASIFAGGFTKGGPVPGEGMFGSRPGTPSNAENAPPTSNLSKSVLASPAGTDNTWKEGNGISFGTSTTTAPSFKFTSASPSGAKEGSVPNPFGSLFGTNNTDSATSEPAKLGFNFGAPASTPAPGFLGAVSHLGGGSVASSVVSSRATSPGLTDNESVATNETEDTPDDPQTSLMDSRSGEENETCLWEGRSKALMFINQEAAVGTKMKANDWNSMGVGVIRLLQNKETKKTRLVFRVEPSASILINSHLVEGTEYESCPTAKNGALKGTLFYKGNLSRWVFKVKTPDMGNALAKAIEDSRQA
ncbi:hypothetical protein LTR84_013048 [Exophiala bonariae]|uniref:RanBD1 domain-containing protein n=1 Tax=Exophiala bonariae TaxID=1690606 RepID=A0AAV9NHH9_9EURO|nr:hypothetical protein LTR84_013048 [Exophiala bonariae]